MQIVSKAWKVILSILILCGLLILEQIATLPYDLPKYFKNPQQDSLIFGIIGTILSAGVITLLIFIYHKQPKMITFLRPIKNKWLTFGIIVLILFLMIYLSNLIPNSDNQKIINQEILKTPWLSFISTVIVAPIAEELIFRGLFFRFLFPKLNNKWTMGIGILCSSFVFAWLHVTSFGIELLPYLLGGLILSTTYVLFNDIRYDIGLHMLNNLIALL
ncbi:CAAX amino protease [Philodulcilactobacillus myokoensis]|uniref:CAAX amino protease n=1 Tax=Philodulcilactobacillus myokoensis TaxID=2929573 RepID=A0A9W6B0E1_9LACO|nr:CPBP family intramembrane glutamic endopeptidase [Philodulcilactobacillus myokoensis]GLB46466.1 CAAX amino protease [Philodulcilactobacillus myokoensis]